MRKVVWSITAAAFLSACRTPPHRPALHTPFGNAISLPAPEPVKPKEERLSAQIVEPGAENVCRGLPEIPLPALASVLSELNSGLEVSISAMTVPT